MTDKTEFDGNNKEHALNPKSQVDANATENSLKHYLCQ